MLVNRKWQHWETPLRSVYLGWEISPTKTQSLLHHTVCKGSLIEDTLRSFFFSEVKEKSLDLTVGWIWFKHISKASCVESLDPSLATLMNGEIFKTFKCSERFLCYWYPFPGVVLSTFHFADCRTSLPLVLAPTLVVGVDPHEIATNIEVKLVPCPWTSATVSWINLFPLSAHAQTFHCLDRKKKWLIKNLNISPFR